MPVVIAMFGKLRASGAAAALAGALALTGLGIGVATGGAHTVATPSAARSTAAGPAGLRTYTDHDHGFAVSFPAAWQPTPTDNGLLLAISGGDAVNIHRTVLAHPIDAGNIAELRAVTDAVLDTPSAHLTILKSAPTQLGGLPGMYYLYAFSAGAQRGAHTHYFAFAGRDMYTVVCQALPAADFGPLATDFDAVVSSFRPLPA
ncbi:MAG TPA: hypothetical protein VE081_13480 [Sporichthyaceae bacterium]|nr:hypothetical protein [Sporichthyaceae bacterium]